MSHNSVAKSVRLDKENNPQNYCWNLRCLWRTRSRRDNYSTFTVCPKHGHKSY